MSNEAIVVEVKDNVDSGIAAKIRSIASEARSTQKEINSLQKELGTISGKSLGDVGKNAGTASAALRNVATATEQLARAENAASAATATAAINQSKMATAAAQAAAAQAKAATAATQTAAADAKLAQETARVAAEQDKAALAALRLSTAQQRAADAAAKATEKQRQLVEAQKNTTTAFDKGGISVKQYNAAMRGVPAQITDIVVSLQGGQRPLSVLLQQGGQLKDMFGGIVPAAKALATGLLALINPYTILAAVATALAVAFYKGSMEFRNFEIEAIKTGSSIAKTSTQFADLQNEIVKIGGTKGQAAEALTEIARAGNLVGTSVTNIAKTAVVMQKAFGDSIEDTVKQFSKLAKEPLKATLELNQTYNYLTVSVYDQIKALEKLGDSVGAARVAEEAYSSAMQARAKEVVENAGYIESAWKGIKNAAASAWDAMLGVGRDASPADKIAQLQKELDEKMSSGKYGSANTDRLKSEIAGLKLAEQRKQINLELVAAEKEREKTAIGALEAIEKQTEQTATKQDQLTRALKKYRQEIDKLEKSGLKNPAVQAALDPAKIAKDEAAIREKYKSAAPKKEGETRARAIEKINTQLRNEIDLMGKLGVEREKDEMMSRIQEGLIGRGIKLSQGETKAIQEKIAAIVDGREAAAEYNRIYTESIAPQKAYNATLTATTMLLAQGKITRDQAIAQSEAAMVAYQKATDPLYEYNKQLQLASELQGKYGTELQVAMQVQALVTKAQNEKRPLDEARVKLLREEVALTIEQNALEQAKAAIYANGPGKRDAASTQIKALASPIAGVTEGDRANERNGMLSGMGIDTTQFKSTLDAQLEAYKTYQSQLDEMKKAGALTDSEYASAETQLRLNLQEQQLKGQKDLYGQLAGLATSSNKELAAIGKAAAITQATMDGIVAVQRAYATGGMASAAVAAVVAAANVAKLAGFEKGGYTGNGGTSQVAGVVHGKEFVMNAQATARNRGQLEAMNAGKTVPTGGGSTIVNVINNSENSTVRKEERQTPTGKELDIYIENVVAKSVRKGGKVASAVEGQYDLNRARGAAM